jgi:hypothetical protein
LSGLGALDQFHRLASCAISITASKVKVGAKLARMSAFA